MAQFRFHTRTGSLLRNEEVCWGIQISTKVLDPTLTKVGLSARSTLSTNGLGRARRTHSMWKRGLI